VASVMGKPGWVDPGQKGAQKIFPGGPAGRPVGGGGAAARARAAQGCAWSKGPLRGMVKIALPFGGDPDRAPSGDGQDSAPLRGRFGALPFKTRMAP
jgi:hypothetical protein